MTVVDGVADRLADKMSADRQNVQMIALQDLLLRSAVFLVLERLVDLEVVAPAGELEPVETPAAGLRGQILEWQVGPLAGEERDGTGHQRESKTPGPIGIEVLDRFAAVTDVSASRSSCGRTSATA